jgi:hypothetical protein
MKHQTHQPTKQYLLSRLKQARGLALELVIRWPAVLFIALIAQACGNIVTPAHAGTVTVPAQAPNTISTPIVPLQNPWDARLGVDSIVLVPAYRARQLSTALAERNGCVTVVEQYRDKAAHYDALRVVDSNRIETLKTERVFSDSLSKVKLDASESAQWRMFFTGTAVGVFVTGTASFVLLLLLGSK